MSIYLQLYNVQLLLLYSKFTVPLIISISLSNKSILIYLRYFLGATFIELKRTFLYTTYAYYWLDIIS